MTEDEFESALEEARLEEQEAEQAAAFVSMVKTVDAYLPAVVGLALRETVRTPAEQDALLALARLVANPMWPADQEAEATWMSSPCEDCEKLINPGMRRCLSCAAKTARTP